MRITFLVGAVLVLCASCKQQLYIVRHGEKEAPTADMQSKKNDPALSAEGRYRMVYLGKKLSSKKIKYIYSTNFNRTRETAGILNNFIITQPVMTYPASLDSLDSFIGDLKKIKKGNILIVGHSNTIDDIANRLCKSKVVDSDIPETDYNNLFIITRKGKKYSFKREIIFPVRLDQ